MGLIRRLALTDADAAFLLNAVCTQCAPLPPLEKGKLYRLITNRVNKPGIHPGAQASDIPVEQPFEGPLAAQGRQQQPQQGARQQEALLRPLQCCKSRRRISHIGAPETRGRHYGARFSSAIYSTTTIPLILPTRFSRGVHAPEYTLLRPCRRRLLHSGSSLRSLAFRQPAFGPSGRLKPLLFCFVLLRRSARVHSRLDDLDVASPWCSSQASCSTLMFPTDLLFVLIESEV